MQSFRGYSPPIGGAVRELDFVLTAGEVVGVESIIAQPYCFGWTLELSESPWPRELQLPHELPRKFFGHRSEQETKPSAAPVRSGT
jgi:hypothetical protein